MFTFTFTVQLHTSICNDARLAAAIFHDKPHKPVPICFLSGFLNGAKNDGGGGDS